MVILLFLCVLFIVLWKRQRLWQWLLVTLGVTLLNQTFLYWCVITEVDSHFFFLVFLWFTFLFLFSSCEGCDFSIHSVIYYLECYLLPQNTRIKGKNLNLVNKEPPPLQKHRWGLDKAYQKRKAEAIIQLTHFRLGWQPWGTLSCKTSYSPSNFLNCCTCSLTIKKCNDFFF
jgi:hypothetical protein